jgi:pilus assembly protein TadC
VTAAALVLLAVALVLWPPPDAGIRRLRLEGAAGSPPARRAGSGSPGGSGLRWLLPAAVGLGVTALFGGAGGIGLGAAVTVGTGLVLHRARHPGRGDADAVGHELPVACDLLAVCLGAGVPVATALGAVAAAVAPPLRGEMERVAGLYRLGAEPARAWAGTPAVLGPLARAVLRAGRSGSAVGAALRATAADVRADQAGRAEAAVRRAGVWVLAPLGACFLPAFVCLGVLPLVLGLAAGLLT